MKVIGNTTANLISALMDGKYRRFICKEAIQSRYLQPRKATCDLLILLKHKCDRRDLNPGFCLGGAKSYQARLL